MSRFVTANEIKLPISDGDYLIVKERLNHGEATARTARMLTADGSKVDLLKYGMATVQAYLIDWSITDDHGLIVAIRNQPPDDVAAILDNLEEDDFKEILEAIDAHETRTNAAREEKKRHSGATASAPSSRSLVAVAGGMSGSGN